MDNNTTVKIPALKPIYPAKDHQSFRELLRYVAKEYSTDDAFIAKTGKDEKGASVYTHITYKDFETDVNAFGAGMIKQGMMSKRIAILGINSYQWYMTYFATMRGLGISVPLDKGLPYEEVEYSLIKSKADCLIFGKEQLNIVKRLQESGKTSISLYIAMDAVDGFTSLNDVMEDGRRAIRSGDDSFASWRFCHSITLSDQQRRL